MSEQVSVITPLYNSAPFIRETIESVLRQTYTNWEMIIVDDCSTDEGVAIVDEYRRRDTRINFYQLEANSGPAKARNLAISKTSGRYIAFLDSDDLWLPEKLSRQVDFMQKEDVPFSFTAYRKISEEGKEGERVIEVPQQVDYQELLKSDVIGCLTVLLDVKKLGKPVMPDIRKGQDYGLWLKLLKGGIRAYGLNEPLALYRTRTHSVSSNKFKALLHQWRIYRQLEQLTVLRSLYFMLFYTTRGLRKYLIR